MLAASVRRPAGLIGRIWSLLERDRAQDAIEYALLAALISIVAIGIVILIGPYLQSLFQNFVNSVNSA